MFSHIVISVLLCAPTCEPSEIRVWDGDSIRLGSTYQSVAVRLFNIDAPEIEGRCAFETDLAQRAKVRLAEIMAGQQVTVLRQGTDRYGRTLAAVLVNGRDAGDILVGEGLARTWSGRRESWC